MVKKRKNTEATIQRALIKWIKNKYPDLEYVAIRNEAKSSAMSLKLDKQMGLVAGFPDLLFFYHDYIFHLELKTMKGSPSPKQKEWWVSLKQTNRRKGEIAYGFKEAKKAIDKWMEYVNNSLHDNN